MRSVHIGCSRYSRRCLLKAPSRAIVDSTGARPKAQSPELDIWVWCIQAYYLILCGYRSPPSCVVKRLILLASDPEMMKQHGKLACDGDDRPSLSSLASTLR